MREIDVAAGTAKGTAFRRFRRIEAQLQTGRDVLVLHHHDDREAIATLRASQRIYAGSVNVVLVTTTVAARIVEDLRTGADGDR